MLKPILDVGITTLDDRSTRVRAIFDTGSPVTIVRQDALPPGAVFIKKPVPVEMRTAAKAGKLRIVGATVRVVTIGDRMIQAAALVSPDLTQDMLIGAETMRGWGITIREEVIVGRDLRDPDNQEVD